MNQPNRRNKSSAPYRASQGDPNEWVSPHVQQSATLVNANGHAVSPLVRRKTIQNTQLGRPRNDYDRRQISNVGPNTGADLALPQSNLGPGTDSYTRSNVNARLYTGTPPSGHVATNAVTQLPVSPSSRQSRHTRNGSYTNHPFAAPVSITTNISSPPPSIRSPAATRARTRRATTTTTINNAHSLLFSSNQPSSHPSTMDNFFWPGPTVNGHSVREYDNITSVTSVPVSAPMLNQDSHGSRLYNYDGTCPPANTGSERMPRGLPADSRPGGKIAAASVVFLPPGSPSLPASNDNQRPVASLAEAPHTNSGLASYHDTFPQLYIAPQTYSPPNPAAYYPQTSVYDPMSTPMPIHPRSEHVHPQYLQSNYDGNPHLVPSYYSQAPPSPTSLRSPSQHHRASIGYAPYSLPAPNYVGAPAYHTNELVPTPDLHTLIDANQSQYISVPGSMNGGVMGSPLLHTSPSEPPSDLDRPHASPGLKNASRFPGQRLDVDQQLLNASFCGADEDSRSRRAILDEIQCQGWYLYHEQEPRIESLSDPAARGLGMVGRSIYTVFLSQDESGSHWRCLFGGHGARCDRSTKQFERVERAIEHVRRHLGHRPYACDDVCLKSQTSGAPCGQRFFASQYLQDHKRRPQKRKSTAQS